MKLHLSIIGLVWLIMPFATLAQPLLRTDTMQPEKSAMGLFESSQLLNIKITGNINELANDRGAKSEYHGLTFSYNKTDNNEVTMPVKIKTRGHFRKAKTNCLWPPLLLNFAKKDIPQGSPFEGQDKLKLVMPCRGDEYVIKEWLIYKLYNLITPRSFRARLVKVTMDDSVKKKQNSFYGILLEDEGRMAKRNTNVVIDRKLNPVSTEADAFLTMAVFQYMIGNTDWSVQYLQNISLLAKDTMSIPTPVPFDFDHAGLVNAPYAQPAEELEMSAVTERRYRGYCVSDIKAFEPVIELFNKLKKDFYAVYTDCSFLTEKQIRNATRYLDEFYSTINNPKEWKKEFGYPCDKHGTGNVIIKGLKN